MGNENLSEEARCHLLGRRQKKGAEKQAASQ
jgi:hypothetical protein